MEIFEIILWYTLAGLAGAFGNELDYVAENQKEEFNHGMGVWPQIKKWWRHRWDDFFRALFFGYITAFFFHGVHVNEIVTKMCSGLPGLEGQEINVTSYGITCIFAYYNVEIKQRLDRWMDRKPKQLDSPENIPPSENI